MLDLRPGAGFTLACLFQALAEALCLFASEHVVGVDHALGFNENAVGLPTERHEVALMELERVEHLARDHHLAALPHASNLSVVAALVAMPLDYLTVRNRRGAACE